MRQPGKTQVGFLVSTIRFCTAVGRSGGDHTDWLAVLVDGDDPPFRICCFVDDLTGHIGEDRSKTWDFSGLVVDTGQGGHIHFDLDHPRSPVDPFSLVWFLPVSRSRRMSARI